MAPEQIEGTRESGPEGDVFALGSTLAWAATSRGPFTADQTAATLYRIIAMPPDLRGIPPRIASDRRGLPGEGPRAAPDGCPARGAAPGRQRRAGVRGHGDEPTGRRPAGRARSRRAERRGRPRASAVGPHAAAPWARHARSGAYHGAATLARPPAPPPGLPQAERQRVCAAVSCSVRVHWRRWRRE